MGENFDDYPDFQPKITHPKHFSRQWNLNQLFFESQPLKVFSNEAAYTLMDLGNRTLFQKHVYIIVSEHLWVYRKFTSLFYSQIPIYRTRAIIPRGLYTFYLLFEGQKRFFKEVFSENSAFISIQDSRAGYDGACTVINNS